MHLRLFLHSCAQALDAAEYMGYVDMVMRSFWSNLCQRQSHRQAPKCILVEFQRTPHAFMIPYHIYLIDKRTLSPLACPHVSMHCGASVHNSRASQSPTRKLWWFNLFDRPYQTKNYIIIYVMDGADGPATEWSAALQRCPAFCIEVKIES